MDSARLMIEVKAFLLKDKGILETVFKRREVIPLYNNITKKKVVVYVFFKKKKVIKGPNLFFTIKKGVKHN